MTNAQQIKLSKITPILHHYMNPTGDLVIITTYGSKRYQRIYIGKRGGWLGCDVFAGWDEKAKEPYKLLFKEHN